MRTQRRDNSPAHLPKPDVVLDFAAPNAYINTHGPGFTPIPHLAPSYYLRLRKLMPTSTVMSAYSYGIFLLCFGTLGFQSDETIGHINNKALAAAVLGCLASGVALLFGFMRDVYERIVHDQHHKRFISRLFDAASCAWLLVAATSFSTFVTLVAWTTSPRISTPFFIIFGCVFSALLVFTFVHHGLRR